MEKGKVIELTELIKECDKKNHILYKATEGFCSVSLEEFVKQPVDGLLYDLNRDEVTCMTFIKEGDRTWINNYATAKVIKYLMSEIAKLKESQKT